MKRNTPVTGAQSRVHRRDASGGSSTNQVRRIIRTGFRIESSGRNHSSSETGTSRRIERQNTETQTNSHHIPPFNIRSRVRANAALLDHLEVVTNHGCISGSTDEFILFRSFAGAPPMDNRSEVLSERYGRIFSVTPNSGYGTRPIVVRESPIIYAGRLLPAPPFSGKLETFARRTGNEFLQLNIKSKLHLNPSRGINYTPFFNRAEASTWSRVLFMRRNRQCLTRGLDGKDNIVPSEHMLHASSRGQYRYLHAVYQGMDSELIRASPCQNPSPPHTPNGTKCSGNAMPWSRKSPLF